MGHENEKIIRGMGDPDEKGTGLDPGRSRNTPSEQSSRIPSGLGLVL